MSDETEPLKLHFYDADTDLPPAGATALWMYVGDFTIGEKVAAVPVVMVNDGEGHGFIAPNGEPTEATVIDG